MRTFHDRTGAAWDIELNVGSLRRIASRTGTALLGAATGAGSASDKEEAWFEALPRQATDVALFSETIWALVEGQADSRGVSRDAFEGRMDGDAIRAALDALSDEIEFFSHPALRDAMAKKERDAAPASSPPPSANAPGS